MVRRKSAKKVYKKPKLKVATIFNCPVCDHPKTVECKMDRKKKTATLECRVCNVGFDMAINHLSDPVDVFHEWIDTMKT